MSRIAVAIGVAIGALMLVALALVLSAYFLQGASAVGTSTGVTGP
jgi:hypothetical protein